MLFALVSLIWQPSSDAISIQVLSGPSWQHIFGTDELGRDVSLRIVDGGGALIVSSLCAALIAVTIGTALGAFVAYRGGGLDFTVMRTIDVLLSIPLVITALLASALLPSGYLSLTMLVGLVQVLPVTRVTRGIFGDVFRREYVLAAALRGESTFTLIAKEAMPNVAGPLLVELALRWSFSLLLIASLNFLGVGVQPPQADWGLMLYEGRNYLLTAPWLSLIPAALIAGLAIAINFTADGVSRALGYGRGTGTQRL
jgi:peptide/nickel transport system permease protein